MLIPRRIVSRSQTRILVRSIKRMLSLLRVFVADDCCPTLTSREEQLANDLPFSEKFSVLPESAGEWG